MNRHLQRLHSLCLAAGTLLALCGTSALAEQTIGIQTPAVLATATARVNLRVVVTKIIVLRVGDAAGTVSDVTLRLEPPVAGILGNSLAYGGAIPPTLFSNPSTVNPISATGTLTVGAWTNGSGGGTLTCALGVLGGATPFATGPTAAGVPGTDDITVTDGVGATDLQHPGTGTLTACDGATNSPINFLTVYGGTFTYGITGTLNALAAGTYGNTITYTATTP